MAGGARPERADWVHGALAQWAACRGERIALRDDGQALSFAVLHERVQQRARALAAAPAVVWVDEATTTVERVIDFLAIVASGRCAAVGDPDWPAAVRDGVRATLPQQPVSMPLPRPESPFYIGFTSGSSGQPKGFRRDHRSWVESFRACLQAFGPDAAGCLLAPGRISHSLFLFGMLFGLWSGGGVVVQDQFSAARALQTLGEGSVPALVAVPSQLVLMIELAAHRGLAPIESVRLIMISGARWMRQRTPQLQALFPRARIVEFYGASETSFIAWIEADAATPAQVVGRPFANVDIEIRDRRPPDGPGLIFVRSPMLFMDYVGGEADPTAALRDGDWLSVRDLGQLDAEGRLCLVGRQNRMIVTQGKNLFPEEVEALLLAHPGVVEASVQGVPDPLRGLQVVAIVRLAEEGEAPGAQALSAWCRERLEGYKVPRRHFVCADWPFTASGKTDHAALGQILSRHLQGESGQGQPCLRVLS